MRTKIIFLVLAGLAGGLLGGMGLGGGTMLIPILTLILKVDARIAAWLNLLTFLPMSVISLYIHSKNGLVVWRDVLAIVPFAMVSAAVFSLISTKINETVLRKFFGWFLISLGTVSFLISSVTSAQKKIR